MRLASQSDLRRAIRLAYLASEGHDSPLLGEMMIEAGVISRADLTRAIDVQKNSGRKLGEILQDSGLISAETLAESLMAQSNRPLTVRP